MAQEDTARYEKILQGMRRHSKAREGTGHEGTGARNVSYSFRPLKLERYHLNCYGEHLK